MRLFYAVFLPEEVRAALVEAQTKVRPFRGWKPVPPHQLHLTLLFLGERPEEELPDYLALGHRLARLGAPFRARLRGTGYFPNEGTPGSGSPRRRPRASSASPRGFAPGWRSFWARRR